ncbi:MAG: hypothetical protein ACYC8T_30880 [Myxococcaceae bacterium]
MSFATLSFACIECGTRHEAQGKCSRCGGDSLMDLRDSGVRVELAHEDDQRRSKRRYLMVWPAVPVAIVVFLFVGGVVGMGLGGLAGYGTSLLLAKVFPAKQLFPYVRDR